MKGAKREDIDSFVCLFWEKFLPKYQNELVIDRLNWHHVNGHMIYIVTASFDFYTQHLVRLLPVTGVIATRAEWDGEVLTGKILGENCRGTAKVRRIESDLGISLNSTSYYAYTDSESDIPLMEKAEHAIMVKSKKIMRWSNPST
jgi:HAD superfamily phosphoserine phosphatase-like hydrolase